MAFRMFSDLPRNQFVFRVLFIRVPASAAFRDNVIQASQKSPYKAISKDVAARIAWHILSRNVFFVVHFNNILGILFAVTELLSEVTQQYRRIKRFYLKDVSKGWYVWNRPLQ